MTHNLEQRASAEIPQLTGLRGLAAFDVMMNHLNGEHGFRFISLFPFQYQAVDLFFCLSAFILCVVYGAGTKRPFILRNFVNARFARIYPLYCAVFVFTGLIVVRHYSGNFAIYPPVQLAEDIARQLLVVNAWPILGNGVHWNVAAWSVSVEVLCYLLVFPPLFAMSRWHFRVLRMPVAGLIPWGLLRAAAAVSVALIGGCYGYRWFDPAITIWITPSVANPWAYWAPAIRGASMFVSGWLIYLCHLRFDIVARLARNNTGLIAVATVAALAFGQVLHVVPPWLALGLFPLLIAGLMNGHSATARFLAWTPLHFLGVISYSLYLLHLPILYAIYFAWPDLSPFSLVTAATVCTLAVSSISYYGFEEPARRALRRWLNGGRLAVPTGAETPGGSPAWRNNGLSASARTDKRK